jgi:hypothetical protein
VIRRRWTALAALVLAAGCTRVMGPARTAADYEAKAASTADAVLSAVRTAQIAADASSDGRTFAPYSAVALADAEADAEGASAAFASVQPPGRSSDALRDELTALTDEATSTLATLRITARRGQLDRLAREAAPLDAVARRLEAFSERHG